MNVYDFDKTIYKNDSSIDFYLFNLLKKPSLIRFMPSQFRGFIKHYLFKTITLKEMKEIFYQYFKAIDNIEKEANLFWDLNLKKINKWYLSQKKNDDVIISASPYFIVNIAAERLGVKYVIASEVDNNGNYHSENCSHGEKINRFIMAGFKIEDVESFYSDSQDDLPFAKIAPKAYLVCGENIKDWNAK